MIGLLTTAIGIAGSWHVSLWTDEAATISAATRSLPQLLTLVQHVDAVHGAYYLFMHAWIAAFGFSPFSVRLPSAIVAGIAAAGVVLLGRTLFVERAAVVAGLVFAVLPRVTWMGIEARSFSFTAAVSVWLTLLLIAALRGRAAAWFGYALLAGIGVALNVYVALLLVAHALSVLIAARAWRTRLVWLACAIVAAVLAAPVLLLSAAESGQIGSARLGLGAMVQRVLVNEFFLGETPSGVHVAQGGSTIWKYAALVLAAVCWLLMLRAVLRVSSVRIAEDQRVAPHPLAVLLPWLLLPTCIVAGYSLLGHSMYNPRYFTFCAGAAALLIGAGIASLKGRFTRGIAFAAIVVLCAPIIVSQRGVYAKSGADFSVVAARVAAERSAAAGVYFAPEPSTSSAVVIRTSRQIEFAYPNDFAGLHDVTRVSSAAADGTLWGTDRRLSASAPELAGLDELIVIRRKDYPSSVEASEDALLERAGFVRERTDASTVHMVEAWTRG